MNDKRRGALKSAIKHLKMAETIISDSYDQECDCLDNMPENLLDSDKAERMEEVADLLSDAENSVSDAIDKIEDAIRR